eukprot:SAG11_NODE_392_length_9837_cov_9.732183_3_plen_127_part_00
MSLEASEPRCATNKRSLFSEGILTSVEKGGGREVLVIGKFRGFIHRFEFTRYRGTAVLSSTKITRSFGVIFTYSYNPYQHGEIMPRRSTVVLPIQPADADLIHCGYFGVKSAPVGLPPNLIGSSLV